MKNTLLTIFLAAISLSGAQAQNICAPDTLSNARPAASGMLRDSLPASWEYDPAYFQTTPDTDPWWSRFGDPILDALIKRAVANNFNVAAAQKRIEAARRAQRVTRAGYFPTISAAASWNKERTSGDMQRARGFSQNISYFDLGLNMNWEIDVFGRIKSQLKADKADYEATVAEYDATLISLCANLAKSYFQLRLAQAEIDVANKNVVNAEELLKLAQTRYDVGLNPGIDVVQAQIELTQTKATVPALKATVTAAINQIAVLLGEYPDKLVNLTEAFPLPSTPPPGYVENPESLLRRRPDIVEAEKQLAALAARVGIAKKDFLPTLSVSASVGTEAHNLKDLFGKGSLSYSVMPTLTWTIFEGFARKARVSEAKMEMEAQIDTYNLTVMTAVSEVNNALAQWQSLSDREVYTEMILRDARHERELQIDRYKQGLCGFDDVADAQSLVLQSENSLLETQASRLAALVTLYTALGGGF